MKKIFKEVDCLAMKREIQARLQKKWAGLTIAEIQAAIQKDLATSPSELAKWWREFDKAETTKARKTGRSSP